MAVGGTCEDASFDAGELVVANPLNAGTYGSCNSHRCYFCGDIQDVRNQKASLTSVLSFQIL